MIVLVYICFHSLMCWHTSNAYFQKGRIWTVSFAMQNSGPLEDIYAFCIHSCIVSILLCNLFLKTCRDSFLSSSVSSRLEFPVVVWEETQQMAVHDINYLCCTLPFPAVIVQGWWDYTGRHPHSLTPCGGEEDTSVNQGTLRLHFC